MKNYLLLKVILTIVSFNTLKNTVFKEMYGTNKTSSNTCFVQDSFKYLHSTIISNKNRFEHKKLNILLNELHLSVKSYVVILANKPGAAPTGVYLYFETPGAVDGKRQNKKISPFIAIDFENDIPKTKAFVLFSHSLGSWGEDERAFYGPMVIKTISESNGH